MESPDQPISLLTRFSQLSFRARLAIIGVVFWLVVIMIEDFDWGRGTLRAIVLVLVLIVLLGAASFRYPTPSSAPKAELKVES